jgi:peptide deformylase
VAGTGELARTLQHETDHLRGEVFIDALEGAERRRIMRQIYRDQLAAEPRAPAGATPRSS